VPTVSIKGLNKQQIYRTITITNITTILHKQYFIFAYLQYLLIFTIYYIYSVC